jgi:Tctex-1 family
LVVLGCAVTVMLQQKVGAGLHTALAAHWDVKRDGVALMTIDNGHVECICTVFGVSTVPSEQEV